MRGWLSVAAGGLALLGLLAYGVSCSAARQPGFWNSFEPSVWANIVGVSIAAVLGIPVGFAVNRYFMALAEERNRRQERAKVLALLDLVRHEVAGHSGVIMELQSSLSGQGTAGQSTSTVGVISAPRFRDDFGRQFIQDRGPAEIGETLISFELANYYFKAAGVNRLLDARAASPQQSQILDALIAEESRSLWGILQQVQFEIQQATERLKGGGSK